MSEVEGTSWWCCGCGVERGVGSPREFGKACPSCGSFALQSFALGPGHAGEFVPVIEEPVPVVSDFPPILHGNV